MYVQLVCLHPLPACVTLFQQNVVRQVRTESRIFTSKCSSLYRAVFEYVAAIREPKLQAHASYNKSKKPVRIQISDRQWWS